MAIVMLSLSKHSPLSEVFDKLRLTRVNRINSVKEYNDE
jgi:hypothetical protein